MSETEIKVEQVIEVFVTNRARLGIAIWLGTTPWATENVDSMEALLSIRDDLGLHVYDEPIKPLLNSESTQIPDQLASDESVLYRLTPAAANLLIQAYPKAQTPAQIGLGVAKARFLIELRRAFVTAFPPQKAE